MKKKPIWKIKHIIFRKKNQKKNSNDVSLLSSEKIVISFSFRIFDFFQLTFLRFWVIQRWNRSSRHVFVKYPSKWFAIITDSMDEVLIIVWWDRDWRWTFCDDPFVPNRNHHSDRKNKLNHVICVWNVFFLDYRFRFTSSRSGKLQEIFPLVDLRIFLRFSLIPHHKWYSLLILLSGLHLHVTLDRYRFFHKFIAIGSEGRRVVDVQE